MKFKEDFPKIYNRLIRNSVLKSLIISTLISGSISFLLSLVLWIFNLKFYISLIVFASLTLILTAVIYFLFLKVDDKRASKEIDSLGLKQRAVTMNEFKDDDSLIARIQRENAKAHIASVDKRRIKLALPLLLVILTIAAGILFISSTTITALSNYGIIKNGGSAIEDIIPDNEYELNYSVNGNGYLVGQEKQKVKEGQNATGVLAVSYEGYIFETWSDGVRTPYREDVNVISNKNVVANFKKLTDFTDPEDSEEEGMPSEAELGDQPLSDEGNPMPGQSDGSDNGGAGGQYQPHNQVIDGNTYYGENTFNVYNEDAIEQVQTDPELEGETGNLILDYFSSIRQ